MTLDQYFASEPHGSKIEMARYLGISDVWLSMLISKKRRPSGPLAVRIEHATDGLVTRAELRPDLFAQ